jgi:hypothetical protein
LIATTYGGRCFLVAALFLNLEMLYDM